MADEVAFLSPPWLDALPGAYDELPPVGGLSVVVQHTVTGVPHAAGEVAYWTVFDDGRLVGAGTGPRPDAVVTITAPYAVAADVATGQVEPAAAFMQGRTKVAGDQAVLLRLLALMAGPAYQVATRRLADRTRA